MILVGVMIAAQVTGCVPRKQANTAEVGPKTAATSSKPPKLSANPSPDQVESALRFDLSGRPDDQDYWAPSPDEARCAAKKIVTDIGAERLAQLGYQPGTPGAGLVNIALSDEERAKALGSIESCVNMKEAVTAMFFGRGRISTTAASCMAEVLDKAGIIPVLFASWMDSKPIDALANDAKVADTLSAGAQVCLNPNDLNWPTLRSPVDGQTVIDADAPGGASNSNRPDDERLREKNAN